MVKKKSKLHVEVQKINSREIPILFSGWKKKSKKRNNPTFR